MNIGNLIVFQDQVQKAVRTNKRAICNIHYLVETKISGKKRKEMKVHGRSFRLSNLHLIPLPSPPSHHPPPVVSLDYTPIQACHKLLSQLISQRVSMMMKQESDLLNFSLLLFLSFFSFTFGGREQGGRVRGGVRGQQGEH